MNKLEGKRDIFIKNIENVVKFIELIELQGKIINDGEILSLVDDVMHSSVPYNATIISLYGNVELFVDEVTESYIDELYRIVGAYNELPERLRDKHEKTSGEFLSNPRRFINYGIDSKELVGNLNSCLQGMKNARLNMEMILRHGGNLKSEQITQFFADIGINDIRIQILENERFIKEYAANKELTEESAKKRLADLKSNSELIASVFSELDDLVDQRNQVAHSGKVDQKKTFKYIKETTIPFLVLLASLVTDILTKELVAYSIKKNYVSDIPEVKDVFNNKVMWITNGNNSLKIGDRIFYTNGKMIGWRSILSIRVDGEEKEKVNANEMKDVTIEVDGKIKKNWKYFVCTAI